MQAIAAQDIMDVEARRRLLIEGRIQELTPEEEERIAAHDDLIGANDVMDGQA